MNDALLQPKTFQVQPTYCGRFAPSPTGPLHFGSLVAAMGSYLDALAQAGQWLVRMEDLDTHRCLPGAADAILSALDVHGFEWQGPVMYQSRRRPAYEAALEQLREAGLVFPCACTRREVADSITSLLGGAMVSAGGEMRYPGTCRNGLPPGRVGRAWRLRVADQALAYVDRLQGRQVQNLEKDIGDFVLLRADGLFAYQLAVVVDDAEQGITDIVRGADLLDSTPRQIYLQTCLNLATPAYLHLPVAANAAGEKLSKQTRARALGLDHPLHNLRQAHAFLGQEAPPEFSCVAEFWAWAIAHWDPQRLPALRSFPAPIYAAETAHRGDEC